MELRECYGSQEYSAISGTCKSCPFYINCGNVKPKKYLKPRIVKKISKPKNFIKTDVDSK